MITNETKERILAAANIVDVIGEYVPLKRSGTEHVGNCPFHEERTASFSVNQTKGIYKCFGCGISGDAIDFLMEHKKITFVQAVAELAQRAGIQLDAQAAPQRQWAKLSPAAEPQSELTIQLRKSGKFTTTELAMLGKDITQEVCDDFGLYPLDSYTTSNKGKSGKSWLVEATDDDPFFYLKGGKDWGKIYRPMGQEQVDADGKKTGTRFMWHGKQDISLLGNKTTMQAIRDSKVGCLFMQEAQVIINENGDKTTEEAFDNRFTEVILCSGISDALNAFAQGYNVALPASETIEPNHADMHALSNICKTLYLCYDNDATGMRNAQKLALQYPTIHLIKLPEDLCTYKDRRGKPCKDLKDYFMQYRQHDKNYNHKYKFEGLLKYAYPMKFWNEKHGNKDNKNVITGYSFDSNVLLQFLKAQGIHRLQTGINSDNYNYVHIHNNIVEYIQNSEISNVVQNIINNYLHTNHKFFTKQLSDCINKNDMFKSDKYMQKIYVHPPLQRATTANVDYFFFQNDAVKITPEEIKIVRFADTGELVNKHKIKPHNIRILPPMFDVVQEGKNYSLTIKDHDFSFLRYVYNSCRLYWEKEVENGGTGITTEEQQEHNLCFVAKCAALGYILYRKNELAHAYMIYAIEAFDEQRISANQKQLGGTGKSILMRALKFVRDEKYIDGPSVNEKDGTRFMFAGVKRGITDFVRIDDLNSEANLEKLKSQITGDMMVEAKHENPEIIPFEEKPKICLTSNFALRNFDNTIKRRIWFAAFGDYYHSANEDTGMSERTVLSDCGKHIPDDYTEDEWNKFYNFMFQCLQLYLRIGKVDPPMTAITKRNIETEIGKMFIDWANDFFDTTDNYGNYLYIDCEIDRAATKASFDAKFSKKTMTMESFTVKLRKYCYMHGWKLNPEEYMEGASDTDRRENARRHDGKRWIFVKTTDEPIEEKDDLPF